MTSPSPLVLERLQVEGGFLSGLDLRFGSGLTTVIGPRGAGKTSVLELVRFALGLSAHSPEAADEALAHARSALGDGRVALTVAIDGETYTLTRTVEQESPRLVKKYRAPVVLSQGEVESIGISASARLRLIDGFRQDFQLDRMLEKQGEKARALASKHAALLREIHEVDDRVAALERETESAEKTKAAYEALRASLAGAREQQERAQALSARLAVRGVERSTLEQARKSVELWREEVTRVANQSPTVPVWPDDAVTADPLSDVRDAVGEAREAVEGTASRLAEASTSIERAAISLAEAEAAEREEFRKLRRSLENLQEGAGEVAKRLADLQAKQKGLAAARAEANDVRKKLNALETTEAEALDEFDALRAKIHESRSAVATFLDAQLGPNIQVTVEQSGITSEYANAIANALRGSGMRYNALAADLAANLSPRELVEAIRRGNSDVLADVGGLSAQRATKVIDLLGESDLGALHTADLNDAVRLVLLDGVDYKPTDRLSTGQRCTVVLSVLLSHRDRPLVVDQPEDHLDNAFIVDTLVRAVVAASSETQIIVSTHNANIPVLGNASRVVVLGSDGDHGFVRHDGPLDDPAIVEHITNVMEGGREAFQRRAQFYAGEDD